MERNLFAVCRTGDGLVTKRVPLNAELQKDVADMFDDQERRFLQGVTEEVPFQGSWKPDADQLMFIDVPSEASGLIEVVGVSPVSVPTIATGRFAEEGIKALFFGRHSGVPESILVQQFTRRQMLEHRRAVLFSGNAFRRISEAAFVMPSSLTCVLEDGRIKFRSWSNLRSIFNLTDIYRAATDKEVEGFGQHQAIKFDNVDHLIESSDQQMRKMINQVLSERTLDNHSASKIQQAAALTRLDIELDNGRIIWPQDRQEQKALLQFLVDNRYTGALSGTVYVTNSRRPVQ